VTNPASVVQRQAVLDFAHAFVVAALHRLLHASDSGFVQEALRDMVRTLGLAAHAGVEMPLQIQCSDDRLFHDGQPLDGPSLQARSLLRRLGERDVAMLSFATEFTAEEGNRLLDLLLLPEHVDALSRRHRDTVLLAFGIRHVRISSRQPADPADRRSDLDGQRHALQRYQDLADCLQQNHARAHRDQELAVDATSDVVERTVAAFDEPSLLLSLAMQDDVDRFTVGHSVRVALLALQVARELGADRNQLVTVGAAALLHDIGKSKVPQEILFKQGRLDPAEWHWMSQHPRLGAQLLLEQHSEVDPRAIGAAFCHHLRPDGNGYPTPIAGIVPSGTSCLVRVCDVFEALTSIRPYKRALTPLEAYAVMFRNEQDFDPVWLRRFVRTIGLFPTGTRVLLSSGSDAMVIAQTDCPTRPQLQLLSGPDGATLPAGAPDRCRAGDTLDGVAVRITSVTTHDRCIAVPNLAADPEVLTQTPDHCCLTTALSAPAPAPH
jgi:putative nucleotidyltransferase with HDIG domain